MIRSALRLTLSVLALVLALASAVPSQAAFKMAVTDLEGMEQLQREFGKFREVLSKASGVEFELFPVSNRTAAVEALKSKKVDFVITGPAEYVVFKKRTEATPLVGFSRPDYFTTIAVLAESGITSLEQLKGKKVAFGDVGSTSKHLAPMQLFADKGVNPTKDLQPVYVDQKVGFASLKRGDVAAFATTNDKFVSLRGKDDLPAGAYRVIARGADLPNDLLLVGPHVDKAVQEKVRAAFEKNGADLTAAMLVGEDNQKYKGMVFLPNIKDSDYDYVRRMYATIGQPQFAEFVGK